MYQTDQYEGMIAETVTMRGHNGDVINAYLARPLGAGPFPAMLLIHHAPGWDDGAKVRAAGGAPDARVLGDLEGANTYLRSLPYVSGKIGVFGTCSGGRHAFLAACRLKGFDALIDCWGGRVVQSQEELTPNQPVAPIAYTKDLSCPMLGLFGNEDKSPTPGQVNAHEAELKQHGKRYEFHRYDGAGHGFFYYDRPAYRQEQALDGWNKVFAFCERTLR
jgi:carboxymethylenebutenolidase